MLPQRFSGRWASFTFVVGTCSDALWVGYRGAYDTNSGMVQFDSLSEVWGLRVLVVIASVPEY